MCSSLFFLNKSEVDETQEKQNDTSQNSSPTVKGHVCFFTLREVQKSLLSGKDSQRTE